MIGWIAGLGLFVVAILGAPLFIVLGGGALIAFMREGISSSAVITEMSRLASSPILIAIPMFTFAGYLFAESKTPERLVRLTSSMFGWIPGSLALVAMVGISLINYVVSILPTGLEPKPREKSPEGVKAMFYAIEKDNLVYAQKVLSMGFDPNLLHQNGYTPLQYAALRGNAQMAELFVRNGANINALSNIG